MQFSFYFFVSFLEKIIFPSSIALDSALSETNSTGNCQGTKEKMFANGTLELEEFPMSPIPCFQTAIIGWYMCFILASTCMVNALLLVTLLGNKELRQPINTFVIAITFLNLIGSLVEFPFVIGSSFACKSVFTRFFLLVF